MVRLVFRPIPKFDDRFARQNRYEPPPEFPLASPYSGIVHHLSGPNSYALTQIHPKTSGSVDGAPARVPTSVRFHFAHGGVTFRGLLTDRQTDARPARGKYTGTTPAEPRERVWSQALPFQQFHVLFNSLFKVLFIFDHSHLCAIELIPKQLDSSKESHRRGHPIPYGILTLYDVPFQGT
ncbi:hypothetical protein N7530_013006 [Penicillium desertorum]|uniref:Uncharacterized protein n=1 Tax=Penicillium desertorum TaxID=1303715 RepID=A0A9W9WCN5_9EURO|nr:hypothetical protein N7530_013006 [Penicillium desertorum]